MRKIRIGDKEFDALEGPNGSLIYPPTKENLLKVIKQHQNKNFTLSEEAKKLLDDDETAENRN
jgi:hypothetical protein